MYMGVREGGRSGCNHSAFLVLVLWTLVLSLCAPTALAGGKRDARDREEIHKLFLQLDRGLFGKRQKAPDRLRP